MKYNTLRGITLLLTVWLAAACSSPDQTETVAETEPKYTGDPHSFANPNEVAVTHLDLSLNVDFNKQILRGTALYNLERNEGNLLKLDIRGLNIRAVQLGEGEDAPLAEFRIVPVNAFGDGLEIVLTDSTEVVNISYMTSPDAAALLWLNPGQTHDQNKPFLFTQGQAILTRSWIPIQDSPAIRLTYNAKVRAPEGMLALMSTRNPIAINDEGIYNFEMAQPIPPYLMALAVGDIAFAPLGERTGVYAEPGMLDAASYEFEDLEQMLLAAEGLYGKYAWGRYDVLVLPPSFPFGGMENPVLTFATPTIIAGDKSLTSLIAHELAHSWSGNLVTNASWDDFWLNEGFTVYFEKRIMEAMYGREYAEMLNVLGYQDLQSTVERLGAESADTHLKLDLEGRDPDDGMTDIAYEKGYLMLRWLEELVGREKFDGFLRTYFDTHAFQTMTTEKFITYLDSHLLQELSPRPDVEAWIYKAGLPPVHPVPRSALFQRVDSLRALWLDDAVSAAELPTANWSTHEWLHFLRGIPKEVGRKKLTEMDSTYDLSHTGNAEKAAAWYLLAIQNDYRPAFEPLELFLLEVGRRKFIEPLYSALSKRPEHLIWAKEVYQSARPNYHAVATGTIDELLQ